MWSVWSIQSVSFVWLNKTNRTDQMDFFSILLETQKTVVYNVLEGEAIVSPVECRSSGGLAQLGEHYVRNVGVGGSTPLPSTKPHFV